MPVYGTGNETHADTSQNAHSTPFFRTEIGKNTMGYLTSRGAVCNTSCQFAHQSLPQRGEERRPEPVDEQDTGEASSHKKGPDSDVRAE